MRPAPTEPSSIVGSRRPRTRARSPGRATATGFSRTFSPKRSRITALRSPRPSTRPSPCASAPAQTAPEKSASRSPLSRPARRPSTSATNIAWICAWMPLRRATSSGRSGLNGSSIALLVPAVWRRRSTPKRSSSLSKPNARRDDADRADERGRVGENLVAGAGEHVAAGGAGVLDEGEHRQLLLLGERPDAAEDQMRLRRRSARRVDDDRDRRRVAGGEGPFQRRRHGGDRKPLPERHHGADHPRQPHHRDHRMGRAPAGRKEKPKALGKGGEGAWHRRELRRSAGRNKAAPRRAARGRLLLFSVHLRRDMVTPGPVEGLRKRSAL